MQPSEPACIRCGEQHLTKSGKPSCVGHRKGTGEPCRATRMHGTDKCRMHIGKKAAPVMAEARARQAMATYGIKIETTGTEALLDEVKWTAGHVAYARGQLQALTPGELVWGTTQRKISDGADEDGEAAGYPKVVESTEAAEPNVWLKIYQAERTHLVRVCSEAVRCGIEERRIRLAEEEGAELSDLIRAVLAELNLTPEQQALIPEVISKALRAAKAAIEMP